jgi:hypothetical protein
MDLVQMVSYMSLLEVKQKVRICTSKISYRFILILKIINLYLNFAVASGPKEIRNAFLNTFKGLKQRVILKWGEEGQRPADIPPNVFIVSWIPQQSVLGKF